MYTHVKYEGPKSYQSKDKVFVDKQMDARTNGLDINYNAPDLLMQGHKKLLQRF